jgi:hypothetical protein
MSKKDDFSKAADALAAAQDRIKNTEPGTGERAQANTDIEQNARSVDALWSELNE